MIVATNVAEASVTIEGIKYVVDSGLVKVEHIFYLFLIRTYRTAIDVK